MLPSRVSSSFTVARMLGSPANITATRYLRSPMSRPSLRESTLSLHRSLHKGRRGRRTGPGVDHRDRNPSTNCWRFSPHTVIERAETRRPHTESPPFPRSRTSRPRHFSTARFRRTFRRPLYHLTRPEPDVLLVNETNVSRYNTSNTRDKWRRGTMDERHRASAHRSRPVADEGRRPDRQVEDVMTTMTRTLPHGSPERRMICAID